MMLPSFFLLLFFEASTFLLLSFGFLAIYGLVRYIGNIF